jgi:hypothetical protein
LTTPLYSLEGREPTTKDLQLQEIYLREQESLAGRGAPARAYSKGSSSQPILKASTAIPPIRSVVKPISEEEHETWHVGQGIRISSCQICTAATPVEEENKPPPDLEPEREPESEPPPKRKLVPLSEPAEKWNRPHFNRFQTSRWQLVLKSVSAQNGLIDLRTYGKTGSTGKNVNLWIGGDVVYLCWCYSALQADYARELAYYLLNVRSIWEEKYSDHKAKELIPYEDILENLVFDRLKTVGLI